MNYYPFLNHYPTYSQENYILNFEMAKKLQQMTEMLQSKNQQIENLANQNISLKISLAELQHKLENQEKKTKIIRKSTKNYYRKNSVSGSEKDSRIYCPYNDCHHHYSSILALNFHIKFKHNGGNKKQRQAYAKIIIQAELNNEEPPKINFNFPPGFLQKYRQNYYKAKRNTDMKQKALQIQKQSHPENLKTE